ncbi:hypothetical protein R1sor_000562 [Riccia sorocarpa]|uniref:Uncharacterized protein n=1 Tax=Riccia sorocarpa TaxID=122646 RepID=A0ABD3GWP1_9MARC
MPPKITEFQQIWSIQLKCPVNHSFLFLTGDLETAHGVPDITSKLYHSALYSRTTHVCLESLCEELGLPVPHRGHFYDFQSGKRRQSGWIRAILDLWEEKNKKKIQADLLREGKPLVLYVLVHRTNVWKTTLARRVFS